VREPTLARAKELLERGRPDDVVGLLGTALQTDPDYPPYLAYLALALFEAGHRKQALGAMLHCALAAARPDAFDGCEAELAAIHVQLLET